MIPHNRPTLGAEEREAAARVLDSAWLAQGDEVRCFEDEFCAFLGLPPGHAVALSSGSAALFLALWVLEAKDRSVAFPVYACAALRNAVAMAGAHPTLADVSAVLPNLDPARLAELDADIVIAPHLFGLPIALEPLPGKKIVEDCAQSLGASVNGEKTGLRGDVGVYSFYATKMITSGGQGGMLVSRDAALVEAVRDYRQFDCRRDDKIRFNFQMTDLQAAIGRVQLAKLPEFIARRGEIYARYRSAGLDLLDVGDQSGVAPVRYRAVIKTERADARIQELSERGIRAIVPVADWELLGQDEASFPHAFRWARETVSLPIYPGLAEDDVDKIIACLDEPS